MAVPARAGGEWITNGPVVRHWGPSGPVPRLRHDSQEIEAATLPRAGALQLLGSYLAFHIMRKFPQWAAALPRHTPWLRTLLPSWGSGLGTREP